MDLSLPFILAFFISYLIGSIPFGLLLTRFAGLGDIRAIGSGNIGATNVLRTGRKGLAAATLFLDGGKGFVATAAMYAYFNPRLMEVNTYTTCAPGPCYTQGDVMLVAAVMGFAALLGHCFPIWLKFKGGKGVATVLGVAFGLHWLLGVCACATWLIMAAVFRYSSLSALVAVSALPGYALWLGYPEIATPLVGMAALIFYRHKANIQRLLAHTEPKIGKKK